MKQELNQKRWNWRFRKTVLLSEVKKSSLRVVMVPIGSHLHRLKDDKMFYTTKDIYSFAYAKIDRDGFRYLVNQSKTKVLYRIHESNTTYVKDIVDLNTKPKFFKAEPPPKTSIKERNHFPNTTHLFAIDLGVQQSQFVSGVLGTESTAGLKLSFDYFMKLNWKRPVKFGLHTSFFDHAYSDLYEERAKHMSLTIGPLVSYNLSASEQILFSVQRSIYSRITFIDTQGTQQLPVKSLSFSFIYQNLWVTDFANFPVGIKLSNLRSGLKDNQTKVSLPEQKKNDLSLGGYIGWEFEL